jgi:hypothetical protein
MKRIGALVAGLVLPASLASAATLSIAPIAPVAPGGLIAVNVNISGGEQIAGAQTLLIIGDGGPKIGGTQDEATSPHIVQGVAPIDNGADDSTVIGAGMIFAAVANGGDQYFQLDVGSGPNPLAAGNGTTTASGTIPANGLLMRFMVDTSTAAPGDYALELNLDNTTVIGASEVTVQGATLTIIPEPASALLLIGALPFLRRRSA